MAHALPPLLDRLSDEPIRDHLGFSDTQLEESVRRDLGWLLSTVCSGVVDPEAYPYVARSVLNYGISDLIGQHVFGLKSFSLRQTIYDAIQRFEPRLRLADPEQAIRIREVVKEVWSEHGPRMLLEGLEIDIQGKLIVEPIELFVSLDLTGHVNVGYRDRGQG